LDRKFIFNYCSSFHLWFQIFLQGEQHLISSYLDLLNNYRSWCLASFLHSFSAFNSIKINFNLILQPCNQLHDLANRIYFRTDYLNSFNLDCHIDYNNPCLHNFDSDWSLTSCQPLVSTEKVDFHLYYYLDLHFAHFDRSVILQAVMSCINQNNLRFPFIYFLIYLL